MSITRSAQPTRETRMPPTDPRRYSDPRRGTRTRQETGRLVGCSTLKVDELVDNRILDAIPVGNRRLITVVSIERLLGRAVAELEAAAPAVSPIVKQDDAGRDSVEQATSAQRVKKRRRLPTDPV